jgi:cell division protein ZapB
MGTVYARTTLTHGAGFPYSQRMDLDLKGLEERVAQLIELSRRLRAENGSLRQQLVVAHNENKQLGERKEAARLRIESLLERVPAAAPRDAD